MAKKDNNKPDKNIQSDSKHYDVSFDYPDSGHQNGHSDQLDDQKQDSKKIKVTPSSKWDNFYEEFKLKQENEYKKNASERDSIPTSKNSKAEEEKSNSNSSESDKVNDSKLEKEKAIKQPKQPSLRPNHKLISESLDDLDDKINTDQQLNQTPNKPSEPLPKMTPKTSVMLDRSIRRARSLFNSLDVDIHPPTYNPYKADAVQEYKERHKENVAAEAKRKEQQQKDRLDGFIDQSNDLKNNYVKDSVKSSKDTKSKIPKETVSNELAKDLNNSRKTSKKDETKTYRIKPNSDQSFSIKDEDVSNKAIDTQQKQANASSGILKRFMPKKDNDISLESTTRNIKASQNINKQKSNDEIIPKVSDNVKAQPKIKNEASNTSNEKIETNNLQDTRNHSSYPIESREKKADSPIKETSRTVPNEKSKIDKTKSYSSDLPSPEEIAAERERRRKRRISQLENLNSSEEIQQTYQSNYSEWLKEYNERNPQSVTSALLNTDSVEDSKQEETKQTSSKDSSNQSNKNYRLNESEDTIVLPANKKLSDTQTQIISRKALKKSMDSVNNTVYQDTDDLRDALISETVDLSNVKSAQSTIPQDNETIERIESVESRSDEKQITKEKAKKPFLWFGRGKNHSNKQESPIDETVVEAENTATKDLSEENSSSSENILRPTYSAASPVSNTDLLAAATGSTLLNPATTDSNVETSKTELYKNTHDELSFHEVEIADSDISNQKRSDKKVTKEEKRKNKYSLANLNLKEKTYFGFNVFFNVLKRFAIYILIAVILLGVTATGAGVGYFAYLVSETPPPTPQAMAEDINRIEQQSVLYYASGEPIASIRSDVVRTAVSLEEISPFIIDGLIATEDEYFYEHPGIMPKATLRAALQEILSPGTGTGGSTLTQQLVKQQMLTNDVTFLRKANEILLALRLENYFSKNEILTAYLNVSPFGRNNNGDNVAGIDKASEGIFGLNPDEVNLAQAAFLVGLPQDPYTYTPYNQYGEIREDQQAGIDRMHEVLFRMYRAQKITRDEYETALTYDITQDFLPTEPREEERQSYLYQAIMNGAIEELMRLNIQEDGLTWETVNTDVERFNQYYFDAEEQLRIGGYRVYSTIDRDIYDLLQEAAQTYITDVAVSYDGVYVNPETGEETYYVEHIQNGLVVIENQTGKVLGFVAGTDFENNQIDHAFNMHRSPGSTIKPLAVYGPAIQHNLISPASIIPDTPYQQVFSDGTVWEPTNYGSYVSNTLLTARVALYRSDNIPAVRIYEQLLNQEVPIVDYLDRMGIDTSDSYTEEDTHNLAFSLGGVTLGPTVFEQTSAFSTFANNGQYVDGYYIERIEDSFGNIVYQHDEEPIEVFNEDTNYLMIDMLRDTNTLGTGRTAGENMAMGGDWIAKSGISENSKDVWYIASTPAITIGSWIGYDSRFADYTIDVNDGYDRESVRSQIYWSRVVNDIYAAYPNIFGTDLTFAQPEGIQEQTILERTGTLPGTITVGGVPLNVTQPTTTDLFKRSNPAPSLSYDFMVGGNEETHASFWNTYVAEERERQRQIQESIAREQAQQNNNESSSSDESENSSEESSESQDETSSTPVDESQSDESTP